MLKDIKSNKMELSGKLVSSYFMKWLLHFVLHESKIRIEYIMKKKTQLVNVFNYMKVCCKYLYFEGLMRCIQTGLLNGLPLDLCKTNRCCLIIYISKTILSSLKKITAKTSACSIDLHWLSVSAACY